MPRVIVSLSRKNGKDVLAHLSVISMDGFKTLAEGPEVEFEIEAGNKGLHAINRSRPGVAAGSAS